jgi:hypothetical protein
MKFLNILPRWINLFKRWFIITCFFSLSAFPIQSMGETSGTGGNNNPGTYLKNIDSSDTPNFIIIYCDNLVCGDIYPFGSMLIRIPELNRMAK